MNTINAMSANMACLRTVDVGPVQGTMGGMTSDDRGGCLTSKVTLGLLALLGVVAAVLFAAFTQ
jgi:hypothetical protein